MTTRQDDAAVVDGGGVCGGDAGSVQGGPVDEGAAARGAPVGFGFIGELGVTLAANAVHVFDDSAWGGSGKFLDPARAGMSPGRSWRR